MGRKNNRKKSAYSRKLRINPKRLISQPRSFTEHSDLTPHRGDVWFAELGEHPGTSVQEGCRPVLIISNEMNNLHSETVTIIPMTSKLKKSYLPTHVSLERADCPNLEPSMVLAEQLTTIGKNALRNFVGRIGVQKILEIEEATRVHLGITKNTVEWR